MSGGLTLEAERQFQSALQVNPSSALAHAGLAQVREHDGDVEAARQEAEKSLALQPNVPAHLVLARLDLAKNQLGTAATEVGQALKLEPANANARGMKQALESRGQQVP
jgi:Tfp pilus assembly protein PilF